MTETLTISPNAPDPAVLTRAAAVLRAGGLVAYPTETVYGLAADALNNDAVARVFDAKGRPSGQPLPVQIAAADEIERLAQDISPEARQLIAAFFPGPLTLVFRRQSAVSLLITGGGETIGLRMPDHPVALGVLQAFGGPLVCPSANLTGRPAAMSVQDVLGDLDGRIDLILDGGPTVGRTPSTVLDVSISPARLIREGQVSRAALEAYLQIAL